MKKILPIALILIMVTLKAFAGPYLSVSASTISSLGYESAAPTNVTKSVIVQSSLLAVSTGTVTVTAPADYEVSLDSTNFHNTLSIAYSNDSLAATRVYIRMHAGMPQGEYNSEQLQFTAPGVSATVTLNGMVSQRFIVLMATPAGDSVFIRWNTAKTPSYEIVFDADTVYAEPTVAGLQVDTLFYTARGLAAGTHYYAYVRGKGTNGNYTPWHDMGFTTQAASGIGQSPTQDMNVHLLPNPNHGTFTITGDIIKAKEVSVAVINAMGQVIYQTTVATAGGPFTQFVSLPGNTPSGMYFVHLSANGQSGLQRFAIAP